MCIGRGVANARALPHVDENVRAYTVHARVVLQDNVDWVPNALLDLLHLEQRRRLDIGKDNDSAWNEWCTRALKERHIIMSISGTIDKEASSRLRVEVCVGQKCALNLWLRWLWLCAREWKIHAEHGAEEVWSNV